MVNFIRRIIEKLKFRKLNRLSEKLSMVLNANSKEIVEWLAKMFAAEGWRLIHTSEMEDILGQIDRAEANAAAALKAFGEIKTTSASASKDEIAEIITEYLYGPQGGGE